MRLWHTQLIEGLPREQLVAQWRELSAIAGAVIKNGTPNHILVNFVLDYDWIHFISYAYHVREEMTRRGYRTMNNEWEKICSVAPDWNGKVIPLAEVYKEKIDLTYYIICFHNLYKKYLCGDISEDDWKRLNK